MHRDKMLLWAEQAYTVGRSLADALEAALPDKFLKAHVRALADIAQELAEEMGIDLNSVEKEGEDV